MTDLPLTEQEYHEGIVDTVDTLIEDRDMDKTTVSECVEKHSHWDSWIINTRFHYAIIWHSSRRPRPDKVDFEAADTWNDVLRSVALDVYKQDLARTAYERFDED